MSERKVLTKYYPPDFDPSAIGRTRRPKDVPLKLATVRLMAPFGMKCTTCGEYIYKGRKFNARKEVTDESYYNIKVIRFYIRCTRCSAEITFKTDPKNMDYACEKGARRNFEVWREAKLAEETEEERLDRLEREENERDPMKELEEKALDAKTEMQIADSLDKIRTRNARIERGERDGGLDKVVDDVRTDIEIEKERQDAEDAEIAKRAFLTGTGERVKRLVVEEDEDEADQRNGDLSSVTSAGNSATPALRIDYEADALAMPPPSFTRVKKKKKDFGAALGIKKKALV